jgi:putative transposase
MPDHLHALVSPFLRNAKVQSWSAQVKRATTPCLPMRVKWQHGCFDRLLRKDESLEAKWHYIRENPVRAGLAEKWEDWPWKVDLTPLQ